MGRSISQQNNFEGLIDAKDENRNAYFSKILKIDRLKKICVEAKKELRTKILLIKHDKSKINIEKKEEINNKLKE